MGVRMGLGLYEPDVTRIIGDLASRCRHMIDCGANTGYFTCVFLAAAAPGARVTAFEPMPECTEVLRKNLASNGFEDRVVLHEAACGAERGRIRMAQVSNMMIGTDVGDAPSRVADVVALDDFVQEPVDLVKLDIEGAEPQALAGMRRLLAENRPVLITELNEYWLRSVSGVGAADVVRELEAHGYDVVPAAAYLRGESARVSVPADDPLFVTEVVAVPVESRGQ
jgi:FkbM family methyltransferase